MTDAPPNGNGDRPPKPPTPPPKAERPPRAARAQRKPNATQLQGKLEDTFAGVSMVMMFAGDTHCATIMAQRAKPLAEAWARLAAQNPRVKAILETLTSGGAYGEVVTVTLATALPIAAHHAPEGVRAKLAMFPLGGDIPGVTPPPTPAPKPTPPATPPAATPSTPAADGGP